MSEVKLRARKPKDSSLDTERARKIYGINIPKLEECIREFVREYKESEPLNIVLQKLLHSYHPLLIQATYTGFEKSIRSKKQ